MNQIKEICLKEKSKNPYMIWRKLIKFSNVPMHGPIHHIIDGARNVQCGCKIQS